MKIKKSYDFVIIGSGFGGAFAAYNLSKAGKEVLVVDRGVWVKRDDSCWDEIRLHINDPLYRGQTPVMINQKKKIEIDWPDDTIGGMSTFYGAAAFRLKENDFLGAPLPDSDKKNKDSQWPFSYEKLSRFYDEAEKLQGVAGIDGEDITEPNREVQFPQPPPEILSPPSKRIRDAAKNLGLHPFNIPLAINFSGKHGKKKCIQCSTCDHYLCKIEAKNDLSVVVLPEAIKYGTTVLSNTRAIKINTFNNKAISVDLIDQSTGTISTIHLKTLIVSSGALSTPHLLLTSGIDSLINNSLIGRNLMRHANGVIAGLFPFKVNSEKKFQKQIAIPDFYFGDPCKKAGPKGNWGMIQDVSTIGKEVIKINVPYGLKNIAAFSSNYLINQLCMAEDIPQNHNRVYVDWKRKDKFGMPALRVYHRYHKRDIAARKVLYKEAKKILRKSGALMVYTINIETFSHAIGTCKFGKNKNTSVLDPDCKIWGMKNLYALDASFMPSGGSVNPSLSIAANSLRVSEMLSNI